MRNLWLTGLALLGCLLLPEAVSAQCVQFSKDIPCEVKNGPMNQLHFGTGKPAPQKLPAALLVTKPEAARDTRPAIDCAMVHKPSPQFNSTMPVITPDPNVKHAMRVTVVPPCKSR